MLARRLLVALSLLGLGCGNRASSTTAPPVDASAAEAEAAASPTDGGDATAPTDAAGPGPDGGDAATALGPLVAYASGYSATIDLYAVDASTGALTLRSSIPSFGTSPSFLAINRAATHLYAVDENTTGRVGAYSIDPATGALTFLDAVTSGGSGPPFVALDRSEAFVLVANYTSGIVSVLPVQADGSLGDAVTTLPVGDNAHMILTDPSNRFAFVPCLGSDYVAQFLFDAASGALSANVPATVATAAGAGPRHLAFHPNGRWVYLINETNSTMTFLGARPGRGDALPDPDRVDVAFRLHRDEHGRRGLGAPVRGVGARLEPRRRRPRRVRGRAVHGDLTPVGFTPSGGMTPRDFTFDPTGTFVYAANQGTGNVVPFRFDASSGTLTPTGEPVDLDAASFVGLTRLP